MFGRLLGFRSHGRRSECRMGDPALPRVRGRDAGCRHCLRLPLLPHCRCEQHPGVSSPRAPSSGGLIQPRGVSWNAGIAARGFNVRMPHPHRSSPRSGHTCVAGDRLRDPRGHRGPCGERPTSGQDKLGQHSRRRSSCVDARCKSLSLRLTRHYRRAVALMV